MEYPLRLLVTSVGSLVATNLFEGLHRLGRDRFFVVGTSTESEAAGNYACDAVVRVPPTLDRQRWAQVLAQWGEETRPDLWIPTRDDDVCALAQLAADVRLPGQAMVGAPSAADLIRDKWLSFRFAIEHGLPVAPSADAPDSALALAGQHGYPLIVKPRCGYGTRGTRLVFDAGQLGRVFATGGSWIAQPFLNPAPGWDADLPDPSLGMPLWYSYRDPGQYSVVSVIGPTGRVALIGATLNTMVCGRPERSMRVTDPLLIQVGRDYAQALADVGWRGPVNVQCRRLPDGRYLMFELAGRLAGGLGAREVLGMPDVWQALEAWCPGRIPPPDPLRTSVGAVAVKESHTVPLSAADIHTFETTGRWNRCS
ncbi:MAG: hypothetical protein Q7T97_00790 [Burkholderiaceae bacterium]|nr:hypothetical protein [Burkholderiaceae bacterium]